MSQVAIPLYPNRKGFFPIDIADYNDGGAYPELHVVQYPLNMGKPGHKSTTTVALTVDNKGEVSYDAIAKQGLNRNKIVQTTLDDIKEKKGEADKLALPDEDEENETAQRTLAALNMLVSSKIKSAKPATSATNASQVVEPTYIRYTTDESAPGYNPAAKQRVIKMVEAQVDPMEPPKHKHVKVPRGPGSPPVPILHSPPKKLTIADQQAWKVPPCISNWKNARGYTIPLDKRLAADGRGLQETTINNKFANLSEALYVSERKASEDLRIRNQIRKKMSMREKEDKEKELRDMATKARMERAGVVQNQQEDSYNNNRSSYGDKRESEKLDSPVDNRRSSNGRGNNSDDEEQGNYGETEEEKIARHQRERLRIDRRKERERELRLENMKGARKNKVDRDEGRDISEKIALGMHKGTGQLSGESMYDSRLFNQSSGLDAGFGGDDEYNTYSKPLFDRAEAVSVYRPKRDDGEAYGDVDSQMAKLSDTSKFKPDVGFKGAEGGVNAGPRTEPVQFEKHVDDPFGISDLIKKKKPRHE